MIGIKYYKIEDTDIKVIPQQLYINNQDLVDFASYIFKQTKVPYLYQEFNKIIDSNKRQLLIKSANKVNLDSIYGFTVFDTINHIPYAIVSRYNNIYDIFTLVHECMHMIINKNIYIKNNQASMYDEVEGFFYRIYN